MVRRAVTDVQTLGAAVREARAARGWTQAQVAQRAGVSRQFVLNLERGAVGAELGRVLAVLRALGRGLRLEEAGRWGASAADRAPALDVALARVLHVGAVAEPGAGVDDELLDEQRDEDDDDDHDRDDQRADDADDGGGGDDEESALLGGSIWGPP